MKQVAINKYHIGNKIKELRLNYHLTISQLADYLYVSGYTIRLWEKDIAFPKLINLINMCNMFYITLDDLIGYKFVND